MAGSGVSIGGTAMLRTRRRDVSIKPNRRLDRKSSRGMIYENEELRLRTININAEVEQGQNDIKKLRRENEQLRKEIWSLRDEYDKLEELVKNQSSHDGSSDEHEGRSGEENNVDDVSDEFSGDEDVAEEEEDEGEDEGEDEDEGSEEIEDSVIPEDGKSLEEDLENAENQKISSEKMNSSLHRLHVEFDDLSVVDEEEELKRDKEKKDSVLSDDSNLIPRGSDLVLMEQNTTNTKSNDLVNPGYFNASLFDIHSPANLTASEQNYFTDCPFIFPNPSDPNYPKMLPMDNSNLIMSPCSQMCLDTPAIGPIDPIFGINEFSSQTPDRANSSLSNYKPFVNYDNNIPSSLPRRRDTRSVRPVNFFNDTLYKNPTDNETPNSGDAVTQNGWDFSRALERNVVAMNGSSAEKGASNSYTSATNGDKPKHFFAPLPSKLRAQRSTEENWFSKTYFDTATSSSSEKTNSTVISWNNNHSNQYNFVNKGTADVCVNGGFPFPTNNYSQVQNQNGSFQSSENLIVDEDVGNISTQSSNNPLVKSLSCHDLSNDPTQSLTFTEKLKMFNAGNSAITKSDNTLDNLTTTDCTPRPFKSQLNVTLKLPKQITPPSPDTPEIPKLPAINYRIFNNPFLQTYRNQQQQQQQQSLQNSHAGNFNIECPATRPLSIQVNEDPRNQSINHNNNHYNFQSRIEDPRLLLMAANQFRNIEENANRDNSNTSIRPNIGFEVTSFERPNPQTLLTPMNANLQNQRLYQNIPSAQVIYPGNYATLQGIVPSKVPAQTQTSIEGDSRIDEDEKKSSVKDSLQGPSVPGSPAMTIRRKRTLRKERSSSIKDKRPLSPAAQRRKDRLRKQNSVTSSEPPPESPVKTPLRGRNLSVTTSTSAVEAQEKNESRSSSSGQDSPKKSEQRRRVSLYFNSKKRPSLVSTTKVERRSSIDNIKDSRKYSSVRNPPDHHDLVTTTNSERERTNSVSSRDYNLNKARKMSTGSDTVPWCACWGNGCV